MTQNPTKAKNRANRKNFVFALLAFAVLSIIAANMQWFSVDTANVLGGSVEVNASGQDVSPGLTAAGLVAIASALFLSISGKIGRYVALVLSFFAAVLLIVATLIVVQAPRSAVSSIYAEVTGTDAVPEVVSASPWPYVLLVFAFGVAAIAVVGLVVCGRWADKRTKYERSGVATDSAPAQGRPAGELMTDERELWDSLTEGIDPTAR